MLSLSVITLLVIGISQTQATFNNGIVYSSDVNHLLTCFERNPFRFLENEKFLKPEDVPIIPLGRVDRQPNANGDLVDVWLPLDSNFAYPPAVFPQLGLPEEGPLLEFLKSVGREGEPLFNENITPLSPPSSPPPRACEIIPSIRGSGGQERIHISEAQDPILFFNNESTPNGVYTYNQVANDRTVPGQIRSDWIRNSDPPEMQGLFLTGGVLRSSDPAVITPLDTFINEIDALCDIWLGKCPLTPIWAELPPNYFPRFLAQGTCSGKNCSFPRGLFCEEDFSYVAHTAVLRWDCCFNPDENPYKPEIWECGWKKVAIPIVCDCFCGCNDRSGMHAN